MKSANLWASRGWLGRVLVLLSFENDEGTVSRALERNLGDIPLPAWLHWIPQLLMSLQRSEAAIAKRVLLHCAMNFPQVRLFL